MHVKNIFSIIISFHSLFLACPQPADKGEEKNGANGDNFTPVQLFLNTNVEQGAFWPDNWGAMSYSSSAEVAWDETHSYSPDHSLGMYSDETTDNFAYWKQTINQNIPTGRKLLLESYIKADAITGQGLYIAIRGDDTPDLDGSAELWSSTQGNIEITGTFDWTKYSLVYDDKIPSNIQSLTAFLIYDATTTGDAWFDDISLTAY